MIIFAQEELNGMYIDGIHIGATKKRGNDDENNRKRRYANDDAQKLEPSVVFDMTKHDRSLFLCRSFHTLTLVPFARDDACECNRKCF
jgi:hypothetical protein